MQSLDADALRSCLNCGATLGGEFCAHCGQHDIEPRVTVTEFVHEFVADHFGLDTKVGRTLFALVRHPGRLTTEFLAGRRIRYVPPLRLYISFSVLFFLIAAWTNDLTPASARARSSSRVVRPDAESGDTTTVGGAGRSAGRTAARRSGTAADTSSDRVSAVMRDTLHDNAAVRFIKRRAHQRLVDLRAGKAEATDRMSAAFRKDLPDALFLLVPVLAALLALLYRRQRRSYAEHFVFALHFQAFVFAVLLLTLVPGGVGTLVIMIAMPIYMFLALRAVYAESALRTTGKLMALGFGYVVANTMIMAVLGLAVFLFG